ncbi:hypothetical protein CYLTODRAFT_485206 [Cylindrobasidium torrendii FP15055 ss-10]|uniref:Uncharacterized protein n=1 Tax=Cylindrobasidium torrendii FP15055 ss-10 TaxID=1314674 RepID=A0A0D7BTI2_9AGAR|nr:hypothetical protein CYLTODRAFT_485206 [Cylindrobasidium torrendii FP15055 ss-10]
MQHFVRLGPTISRARTSPGSLRKGKQKALNIMDVVDEIPPEDLALESLGLNTEGIYGIKELLSAVSKPDPVKEFERHFAGAPLVLLENLYFTFCTVRQWRIARDGLESTKHSDEICRTLDIVAEEIQKLYLLCVAAEEFFPSLRPSASEMDLTLPHSSTSPPLMFPAIGYDTSSHILSLCGVVPVRSAAEADTFVKLCHQPLRDIRPGIFALIYCSPSPQPLKSLQSMTNLRYLTLGDLNVGDTTFPTDSLSSLNLEQLKLHHVYWRETIDLQRFLSSFRQIVCLIVQGPAPESSRAPMTDTKNRPKVRNLALWDCQIHADAVKSVVQETSRKLSLGPSRSVLDQREMADKLRFRPKSLPEGLRMLKQELARTGRMLMTAQAHTGRRRSQ